MQPTIWGDMGHSGETWDGLGETWDKEKWNPEKAKIFRDIHFKVNFCRQCQVPAGAENSQEI